MTLFNQVKINDKKEIFSLKIIIILVNINKKWRTYQYKFFIQKYPADFALGHKHVHSYNQS